MAYPCFRISATKLVPLVRALFNLLLGLVKDILMVLLSCLPLLHRELPYQNTIINYSDAEHCPSPPSLVPVPVHCIVGAIKERVPVIEYGCILERLGACKVNSLCAVCLKRMKGGDEVRELCNCCHVFHRECLDAWIDEGGVTCPLCRAKLLANQGDELKCGGDPWRRERMIYLFGVDYVMSTS